MNKKKPNILLITSDQQRWDCFGFGPRKVRMRNVEQLAARGTRFDCCITPNPLCQPARASILTGKLPLSHGVVDNGIDLNPAFAEEGFAAQLGHNGYKTAKIGKAHLSSKATFAPTGSPECQHSSVNFGEDWFGPYMGFDHVELVVVGHFTRVTPPAHISPMPFEPPHGLHYERWFHSRGEPGEARKAWLDSTDGKGLQAAQTWNSALPSEWHSTNWVTDRSIDWLRRNAASDQPFCMWVSYPDPHHPFDCPAPWNRLYDPSEVDLPEHRSLDLDCRPWWHQALYGQKEDIGFEQYGGKGNSKVARAATPTEDQLRATTANYYGMIEFLDHGVGRLMSELRDLGLDEDTIVVYTTDHGELLGDHGLMFKGPTLYEGLLRVGMVIAGPGIPGGKVVDDPVSTLDLAATFYDYADATPPDGIQSRSLRKVIDGTKHREFALCEWNVGKARYGVELEIRAVRTRRYKAIFERLSGTGELYDLAEDPDELVNLFETLDHRHIRDELDAMCRSRPGAVLDPLPEPSGLT
ncbi:MAG: sulfatase-like hydrolase/transferase [Paracoccaceae bacterium]|nr:sulfatase-like hydrolase/transferase [Paracoccaceae bacterium]